MTQNNNNKKNLEKRIEEQKQQIYNLENEYKTKYNPNYKNESFSEKLSNDLAFFQKQSFQYSSQLSTIQNENKNLRNILDEKDRIIFKFQKVVEEAKVKMELLLMENKKIIKEKEKLKEEIIKLKSMKKKRDKNDILKEVNKLKNELSQMEKYYVPQINKINTKILSLEKNKPKLVGNLQDSVSSRILNKLKKDLEDNNSDNKILSKYKSEKVINNKNNLETKNHNRFKSEGNLNNVNLFDQELSKINSIKSVSNIDLLKDNDSKKNENSENKKDNKLENNFQKGKKDVFVDVLNKKNNQGRNTNLQSKYESFNNVFNDEIQNKPFVNKTLYKPLNGFSNQLESPVKITEKRTYELNSKGL